MLLREKDVKDSGDMLVTNPTPYITSNDDMPLSNNDARRHTGHKETLWRILFYYLSGAAEASQLPGSI